MSYFPEPFVLDALKRYEVKEEFWADIQMQLKAKESQVIPLVESKALAEDGDVLFNPKKRSLAAKLFKETLMELFSDVMRENGVTDPQKIQAMLDDIQLQKGKKFIEALKTEKIRLQSAPGRNNTEINLDD